MSSTTARPLVDIAAEIAATTAVNPSLLIGSFAEDGYPAATRDELAAALQYLVEHRGVINVGTTDERPITLADLGEMTIIDERGDEYDMRSEDVRPEDIERYAACQVMRAAVAMRHLQDTLCVFTALDNARRVTA